MRKYIDLIEAKSTTTKDKTDFGLFRDLESGKDLTTATSRDVKIPGKQAKRKANRRTLNFEPAAVAQANQHFSSLAGHDMQDTMSDDEARRIAGVDDSDIDTTVGAEPVRPTTENLPAVIRKEVAKTDDNLIYPEWHQVKHLPRYIQSGIRALGRQVFGQFTDTPIEDIQMLGTIGGLNSKEEVAGMMNWIKQHGQRDHSANIDFNRVMPGYTADTSLWNVHGYQFLLVKDFAGYYVYGWERNGNSLTQDEPKRLTKESVDQLPFKELDRVILTTDFKKIPAGTRGTVVGVWQNGKAYEVEFTKPDRLVTIPPSYLKHSNKSKQ